MVALEVQKSPKVKIDWKRNTILAFQGQFQGCSQFFTFPAGEKHCSLCFTDKLYSAQYICCLLYSAKKQRLVLCRILYLDLALPLWHSAFRRWETGCYCSSSIDTISPHPTQWPTFDMFTSLSCIGPAPSLPSNHCSLHASLGGLMTHLILLVQLQCRVFLLMIWQRMGVWWGENLQAQPSTESSGTDLTCQKFSVDQGTLQKNNRSHSFSRFPPGLCPSVAVLTTATQDAPRKLT